MRAPCSFVVVAVTLTACAWMTASVAHAQCDTIGDPDAAAADASPWRGSAFDFSQALGAGTLSKGSTLSYDPYYALAFDLCAQWYFRPTVKASIEQPLQLELSDSDSTTTRQEPVFGDTSLRIDARLLTHHFGPGRYAGWNAGMELLAPASPASRAASTVAGARVRTGAKVSTKQVLSGAVGVFEVSYLRRFSRDTTVVAEAPYPCLAGSFASIDCTHLASATNLLDTLSAKLQLDVELVDHLWLDAIGALQWDRAYALSDATFRTSTGAEITLGDHSDTHFRNSRKVVLGVIYEITSFFLLELASTSSFAERNLDGSLRGPFRVSDTTLDLDAWVDLEGLYSAATTD